MKHHKRSSERRKLLAIQGATMVDFALSSLVFCMLIFFAVDLIRYSYHHVCLQYTMIRSARWAVLGKTIGGQSRVDSIKQKSVEIGNAYAIKLQPANVRVCPVTAGSANCVTESAGGPFNIIRVSATQNLKIFFGRVNISITASALGTNEPT